MNYFVTAINTGSGKTLASAIICEALIADYWKPIQSGQEEIDKQEVKKLISSESINIHPEAYLLNEPASPHQSARLEDKIIEINQINLPITNKRLVIEGAGGVLVPLNYQGDMVIDIASKFNSKIILVSNYYLGSINHTLLTYQFLLSKGFDIEGIIFNGEKNQDTFDIICQETKLKVLLEIPQIPSLSKEKVIDLSQKIKL